MIGGKISLPYSSQNNHIPSTIQVGTLTNVIVRVQEIGMYWVVRVDAAETTIFPELSFTVSETVPPPVQVIIKLALTTV
jgi:hypothetical protein